MHKPRGDALTLSLAHRPANFMEEIQAEGRICVSVCEERASDLPQALERAAAVGDVIELRLDCLKGAELDDALLGLKSLLSSQAKPFIITLRPVEQGGRREMDGLSRIAFWLESLADERDALADIELDIARVLMKREGFDWNRVICSHHDFSSRQTNLERLYEEMTRTPARIFKIAVAAADATDCIPIFKLLARARAEGRALIAIAMGEAGVMTRILARARGSFLTYGALDGAHATAPGQPTAVELLNLYRVHKISDETALFGILGAPVAHSVSPHMHNAAFEESGMGGVYIPLEAYDVHSFMRRLAHPLTREIEWNLQGLSVTAPHKRAVMEHLDWIDSSAQEMGAVNTIIVKSEELHGYNTDAAGFLSPLEKRIDELAGKRVAIIGAGGAARSALWGLKRARASVTLFARDVKAAERLAGNFGARAEKLEGADFRRFDIVVNATPLGTRGISEDETPARSHQLRGVSLAYDLVYNPMRTRFLAEAEEAGCETLSGLEMLIAQAAEQFRLWIGSEAPLEVMRGAARRALESKAL